MRFIDLSTPGTHIVYIGINVVPGVLNLWRHKWGLAAMNFGAAIFIIGVNVFLYYVRKRRHARMAEIQEIMGGIMGYSPAAASNLAKKNLDKVVKALGAKMRGENVVMKVGRTKFIVRSGTIIRGRLCQKTTCYQIQSSMPTEEKMASALLLLKRNPKIFDHWACHDKYYA